MRNSPKNPSIADLFPPRTTLQAITPSTRQKEKAASYQLPPSVITSLGHFPYPSTRCKKALVFPSSITKKGLKVNYLQCAGRVRGSRANPGLVHHNNRWEETSVKLSNTTLHMAHTLPQKTQYPGCFPETQAQLLKHQPQSYLLEGDAVLSHDPLGLEEVSRFPGTQPGFSFHGPSP